MPLNEQLSYFDTDALFHNRRLPLTCVSAVRDISADGRGVTLTCDTVQIARRMRDRYGTSLETADFVGAGPSATVRLEFVTPSVVRQRAVLAPALPERSTPMLLDDIEEAVDVSVESTPKEIVLSCAGTRIVVSREPFRIEIIDPRGTTVRRTIPAAVYQHAPTGEAEIAAGGALSDAWPWFFRGMSPLGWVHDPATGETQVVETAFLGQDEHLCGFGERFQRLDKRGQAIHLWQANAAGKTWPLSYKNVPFFMSTGGYGHFVNSTYPVTYHLGDVNAVHHSVHVQEGLLDTFLILDPRLTGVLRQYVALTGRPQVPPDWSFGLWMSRMSYRTQDEVLEIAARLREECIPADVMHIDTDWFATEWVNDLKFSPERFPDPSGMIRDLRDQGFKLTLWQLPYISVNSRLYQEGEVKGYFALGPDGRPRLIDGFFGQAAVIDFTNPDAADWYTDLLRPLFDMGVAAIKTDFGEGAPVDATYAAGDGLAIHNVYPLYYNRAVFERTVECTGEPIIWGRSAYAGSQRYPVYWGGDPAVRWEDLGNVLYGGLGLGLTGFPFWSQDIGGFAGTPDPELYIRWIQAGMFMTHPRAHGPIAREPWAFGDQAVQVFRHYANLRYRLLPYIVAAAHRYAPHGEPVMRAMVLDWQDDPTTADIGDQFMLGADLLIAPILTRGTTRLVYLPEGRWLNRLDDEIVEGPRWLRVTAELDQLPMFHRGESIVLLVDPAACTAQLSVDHVHAVLVTPGVAEASITDPVGGIASIRTRRSDLGLEVTLSPHSDWTLEIHGLDFDPRSVTADGSPVAWTATASALDLRLMGGTREVVIHRA
jgi:alpha-D-xyloside xylohydrolase